MLEAVNLFVQYTHWDGLSPEWILVCLFRLETERSISHT